MIKLSESMTHYQEAAVIIQETKVNLRLKAWGKLLRIQQNIILLAREGEDTITPKELTEKILAFWVSRTEPRWSSFCSR